MSYYIEYVVLGSSVKVSAIDPDTNTEVSIVGAVGTPKSMLSQLAVRKLEYVLRKQSGQSAAKPRPKNQSTPQPIPGQDTVI